MKKLSTLLSVAILQALDDLELCMNDENYIINFRKYHEPVEPINDQFKNITINKCAVCFAGSVIAKRLKPNKYYDTFTPSDFNKKTRDMLQALDSIRSGHIGDALRYLNIDKQINDIKVNQNDYEVFKSQMIDISNILNEHNL